MTVLHRISLRLADFFGVMMASSMKHDSELMDQIQSTLSAVQQDCKKLALAVESINGRVNALVGFQQMHNTVKEQYDDTDGMRQVSTSIANGRSFPEIISNEFITVPGQSIGPQVGETSRIILTTHPRQPGINPIPIRWGHKDPTSRGPVVVVRSQSTFRRRNGKMRHPSLQRSPNALFG